VKDIRIESFLSDLLFIGIENEGLWVEGKEIYDICDWDGTFYKQRLL
jgi:hypothetical protein